MDKRVMFAVAGAGKTTYIINQLNLSSRALIITYTNNNVRNLRVGIIRKFGYFPENIRLYSYFTFLHSFCYKPFLSRIYNTKGLFYEPNPNRYAVGDARYITSHRRLYSNRLSKLLIDNGLEGEINKRLCKYFTSIYIDEIQDFGGNDFNFLKCIVKANLNILFVGDFYQYTYDTSRDGNVNSSLHDDYSKYKKKFSEMGLLVDTTTLIKSYRCSPTICAFITEKLKIHIQSHRQDITDIFSINDKEAAEEIIKDNEIIKLFYNEHYSYKCFSQNWGESKGEDKYKNVCVVLNKGTKLKFKSNLLHELAPVTKNKLYVACSRASNNLFFLSEELVTPA